MTHTSPVISIVIPTWNRPALVARLVGAINESNDRDDIEIVVVDNYSEEKNWGQLQQVAASHKNIRLFRNPSNIGMTPNWNKAIEYARGQWIGFMCDDDMYKPESITRMMAIIEAVPGPCLVLQNAGVDGENDWLEPGIQATNTMSLPPASGQFWHRELTDKLGKFDERIKYCPDAEFWLRLAYHYPVFRVRDYLVIPYQHDTNYMWEAFRSADFLEQVALSIKLSSQHTLGENFSDTNLVQYRIDDGLWETLRTVLNNTFLRRGKMKNFLRYFIEFIKVSIRMHRVDLMVKTILSLPVKRAKELVRGFVKKV